MPLGGRIGQADKSWVERINLTDLKDVTITSPADNELLAYDDSSGEWINQTPAEAGLDDRYVNEGDELLRPPVEDWYDPTGGLPVDPEIGDRYIAEDTAEGWTADYIYEWDGSEWIEYPPEEGWMVWMILEFMFYFFFSGGWVEADSKVGVDGDSTPGYLGAASSDGVLRTGSPISYTDGGDFITLDIAANGINDTHIDWGTGANQVSAVDVPIADSGSYFAGTEVEAGLQVIGKSRADSAHYTGFPGRVDTSLSWDDGTYTLTLTASDDKIWINGVEYNFDTLTKQLTVGQEAATALYWFWITAPGGTPQLNCDSTMPGFDMCLVATVYWNTTTSKGLLSDERHWFGRDQWMHEYLHETVGARYAEGLAGTFTDTTITIEAGEFYDEDIEHETAQETVCTVLYHNGDADWAWMTAQTTPYKVTDPGIDDTLQYNNGNALANAGNNKYVNYWVFVTPDQVDPIHVAIGTAQHTLVTSARDESLPDLGTLPSAENKLIYRLTYRNVGGTPDYIEAADFRSTSSLPSSYVPTDHGSLAGLLDDDHTQYIRHNLSTAASDFLVGSGSNTYIKKTLAETGAILEGDIAHDNIVSGTIAAHDTSATGTELDTLTDSSDADALHTHTGGNLTDDVFVLNTGDTMAGDYSLCGGVFFIDEDAGLSIDMSSGASTYELNSLSFIGEDGSTKTGWLTGKYTTNTSQALQLTLDNVASRENTVTISSIGAASSLARFSLNTDDIGEATSTEMYAQGGSYNGYIDIVIDGASPDQAYIEIYPRGDDTTKGGIRLGGIVALYGSNTELRFYEGSNYIGFEAPALTGNQIWVLPDADGDANDILITDGSGNLSWTGTPTFTKTYVPGASGTSAQAYYVGSQATPLSVFQAADIGGSTYTFFVNNKVFNGTAWVDLGQARPGCSVSLTDDQFGFFGIPDTTPLQRIGVNSSGDFAAGGSNIGAGPTYSDAVLFADADGKVGVNNATPDYDLDVTGDINMTGVLSENGNVLTPCADVDLYVTKAGSDSAAGTAGAPLLTVQEAVDRFKGRVLNNCKIYIGAGTYAEDVEVSGIGGTSPKNLQILGDYEKETVGVEFVHGVDRWATTTNTGSGAVTLSTDNGGTGERIRITITRATTQPDLATDGIDDTNYVITWDGTTLTEFAVYSVASNVITLDSVATAPSLATNGRYMVIAPNVKITSAAEHAFSTAGAGAYIRGLYCYGYKSGFRAGAGSQISLSNCVVYHSTTGNWTSALIVTVGSTVSGVMYPETGNYQNRPLSIIGGWAGISLWTNAYCGIGGSFIHSVRGAGYFAAYIRGGYLNIANGTIGVHAGYGFYAKGHGYIGASGTSARNFATTPYSPAVSDTHGNNMGAITFS